MGYYTREGKAGQGDGRKEGTKEQRKEGKKK
jgi:hypothetical protein